jgi:hypothetical protein
MLLKTLKHQQLHGTCAAPNFKYTKHKLDRKWCTIYEVGPGLLLFIFYFFFKSHRVRIAASIILVKKFKKNNWQAKKSAKFSFTFQKEISC